MSSFQRMIAVPQEEYLALSNMQNVREPLAQHYYSLERRYNDEEKEKDPYRRLVLQSSTLDQMRQVKDQIRNSLVVATPKPYQNRAKALFQSVANLVKFNEKGEIYEDDGTHLIPGSRLEDLIQHAVRDRRRNMTPVGWTHFLKLLREHNVPKFTLNRNTLDELEGLTTPIPSVKREPSHSPFSDRSTMQKRRRNRSPTQRIQPARETKTESLASLKPKKKPDILFLKKY